MRTRKTCAVDDNLLAAFKAAGVTPSEALHEALAEVGKLNLNKAKKFRVGCVEVRQDARGKTEGKVSVCSRNQQ